MDLPLLPCFSLRMPIPSDILHTFLRHSITIDWKWYRNINLFSIRHDSSVFAQVPTHPGRTNLPLETLDFRPEGFSPSFSLLIPAFSLLIPPDHLSTLLQQLTERSPTNNYLLHSFGLCLSPVKSSAQILSTSELLRTL